MLSKLGRKTNAKGFSFLEFLIIILIIGTVAAIATPKLKNYKQRIYDREAKADLENLYLSCKKYWAKNSGALCSLDIVKEASNDYTQSSSVTLSIASGSETKTNFLAII